MVPYNPLAAGMLAGRYRRGQAPPEGSRFARGDYGRMYQERYWSGPMFDVAETVKPGVVVSQSIWWNRYTEGGVNCNTTTSTALTDLGAAATFFDNLVEVEPA